MASFSFGSLRQVKRITCFLQVKAVKLKSGITIEADLLIVGIGMYSRRIENKVLLEFK